MAKNTDIRLATGWHHHPKILMLGKRLGDGAVLSLVKLWTFAGDSKPSGVLDSMDETYIEIAAEWIGEEGAFTSALVKLRLLDRDANGTYSIHDWAENNPHAAQAGARSEIARANANARWQGPYGMQNDATALQTALQNDATACKRHCKTMQRHAKPQICNAPTNQPTNQPTNINISNEICTKKPILQNSKPEPSPILPDCEYFRATESELESAKATWAKNGNDESDFRLAIAEVEFWLGTESPKAKAARKAPSHTRQVHSAWVLENVARRHKAKAKSPPGNLQGGYKTSAEKKTELFDRLRREARGETGSANNENIIDVTPRSSL